MPTYPSYIPAPDADFNDWLLNFDALLTADPLPYGLDAADAAAVNGVTTAWSSAYAAAINPPTRTPVTVAAKDAARASAEAVVRPLAVSVSRNNSVTNGDKAALGVTIPSVTPTPIPAPTEAPELGIDALIPLQGTFTYKVPGSSGKAKPFGSDRVEIATAIGDVHAVDPAQAAYARSVTKSPFRLTFDAADQGKKLTVFARFATRSGPGGASQFGPWSAPLQTHVV